MTKSKNNTKDNSNKEKEQSLEFQKQLEKKAGTWSDTDCGIGFHAWIDKLNGSVVCYVCGKVLYRNEQERPKT